MNMEFLNDLIEYMSLKREVGNLCLHSVEDRSVPAAYAIHRIVSKFITNCQNRIPIFPTRHIVRAFSRWVAGKKPASISYLLKRRSDGTFPLKPYIPVISRGKIVQSDRLSSGQ
jgi:hypothetical protein